MIANLPLNRIKFLSRDLLGWAIFTLVIAATLFIWLSVRTTAEKNASQYFDEIAITQRDLLIDRMKDYEQILLGAAGLFLASDQVTRKEWLQYVESLRLNLTLPGIQGVGYAQMISPRDKLDHEAHIRREGFPGYSIRPDGSREVYSSIIYLEPFSGRNIRAFGYDMYSEPTRRLAMQRAADSGKPAWSSKVTLVQEDEKGETQPGFLVYVPVYAKGKPINTIEERRLALIGFVYSPFRAWDMLGNLYKDSNRLFEVELYSGNPQVQNLLFQSGPKEKGEKLPVDLPVSIGGTEWTARFWKNANFRKQESLGEQSTRFAAILAMEFLLFAIFLMNIRYRQKIEIARQKLENVNREIQLISSLMSQMQNCNREDLIPPIFSEVMIELVPGTNGCLYLLDSLGGSRLDLFSAWGIVDHLPSSIPVENCLAFKNIKPNQVGGTKVVGAPCVHINEPSVKCVCVPLVAEGIAIGVIYLEISAAQLTIENDLDHCSELLLSVADTISLSISNLRLRHSLQYQSIRDPLTDLYNRRYMEEALGREIQRAQRHHHEVAIVILDLDHFKLLNDQYGHAAGDAVLMRVAEEIKAFRLGSDIVCRYGGEEFVLILPDFSLDVLAKRLESFREKIAQIQVSYGGKLLPTTTISMGVARYPINAVTSEDLLRQADMAMYRAKQAGRNRIEWGNAP